MVSGVWSVWPWCAAVDAVFGKRKPDLRGHQRSHQRQIPTATRPTTVDVLPFISHRLML
ncbi:unnamed protein product, partial [Nesidiocoris tenuis]